MSSMAESQSDQSENERPDDRSQSEDDSNDDNESSDESSDDSDGGGLLDTMAADGSDTESSDDEDEYQSHFKSDSTDHYFPQFCRLPIELRNRIWELFCPELRARYRVLDFVISWGSSRYTESDRDFAWTVRDGLALDDQTKNLRAVFAVHQESRAFATNAFPHSLSIEGGSGDATVRFNQKSDVVLVNSLSHTSGKQFFYLPDFASEVKNLAFGGPAILDNLMNFSMAKLLEEFTQFESFYVSVSSTDCQKSTLQWCTSDLVNHYRTETYEKQPGLGEDLQFLWCWPDLERHPDFAKYQINRDTWDNLPNPINNILEKRGIKAWPMVAFEYESGLRNFELLQTLGPDLGDDSDSSDEEYDDDDDNGSDLDQYESDGIDDAEIVETYEDSDDDGISLASGSPVPVRQLHQISDDEDEDDGVGANFSEPEPEPESAPVQRGRKRRVVSDSDDEEEEDVQPTTKRARVIIESDDEDDEPQVSQPERSQKRSRALVSDDEDDDEQGGVSRQDSDNGDSSSSEEESEDSDEDDAPPAKLSLAERLRLHRQENPVDNEDSDDASSKTADVDSEEDEEDDDEERNPFMMGMADESDGEGEDYDEDDY